MHPRILVNYPGAEKTLAHVGLCREFEWFSRGYQLMKRPEKYQSSVSCFPLPLTLNPRGHSRLYGPRDDVQENARPQCHASEDNHV